MTDMMMLAKYAPTNMEIALMAVFLGSMAVLYGHAAVRSRANGWHWVVWCSFWLCSLASVGMLGHFLYGCMAGGA